MIHTHAHGTLDTGASPKSSEIQAYVTPTDLRLRIPQEYQQIKTAGMDKEAGGEEKIIPSATAQHTVLENGDIGGNVQSQVSTKTTSGEAFNEMAAEMKRMVERLRGWRARDPVLFNKLWDDMKKVYCSPPIPHEV
jgi:hypothetical protein